MKTIDQALDLIAARVPALAAKAARLKLRPSLTLKAKAANALIAEALATDALPASARAQLAGMIQPVADQTRSLQIPPVRVTQAQMEELVAAAEAEGVDLSTLIRRRLFPNE